MLPDGYQSVDGINQDGVYNSKSKCRKRCFQMRLTMISNPKILACISFFVGFLSLLAPWTTAFLIYQKLEKGENDFSSCLVPLLAFSTFFMISLVFTLYTIIYEIFIQKLKIWFILGLAGIFKQICIHSCLFASLVHFYQKLKYGNNEDS